MSRRLANGPLEGQDGFGQHPAWTELGPAEYKFREGLNALSPNFGVDLLRGVDRDAVVELDFGIVLGSDLFPFAGQVR